MFIFGDYFHLYNDLYLFVCFLSDFSISFKVKEKPDRKSKTRAFGTPLGILVRITIHSVTFSDHAVVSHFGYGILTRFGRLLKRKIVLETGTFLVGKKEGFMKVFPQLELVTLDTEALIWGLLSHES